MRIDLCRTSPPFPEENQKEIRNTFLSLSLSTGENELQPVQADSCPTLCAPVADAGQVFEFSHFWPQEWNLETHCQNVFG